MYTGMPVVTCLSVTAETAKYVFWWHICGETHQKYLLAYSEVQYSVFCCALLLLFQISDEEQATMISCKQ